jgi:hypothetical protein
MAMEGLLMETAALEERHVRAPGTMQLHKQTQREFSAWMAYVYGNSATAWACCNPSEVLATWCRCCAAAAEPRAIPS